MSKTRVSILGGGLSGLVTAFNLTAPEQQGCYEVTVYQLGWRLGGKCATGRNQDQHQRIQEHGLHVFMGQYDNAFGMVQALYAEAAKPPFADWRQGYTQTPAMSLMEQVDGQWIPWVFKLPVFPGTPGIDPPPSVMGRIVQAVEWLLGELNGPHAAALAGHADAPWWRRALDRVLGWLGQQAEHLGLDLLRAAVDLINRLDPDPALHSRSDHLALADLLHRARVWIGARIGAALASSNDLRRLWILLDLGLANLIGGLRDGLLLDPAAHLEAVNRLDYRAWLKAHGAGDATIDSALVRSLYDLIFAYPEGNWQTFGNVEAGTLFLSLLNTATYQGAIIWKFNTATGDLIVQPLYDVLAARGVKFEFFSRVDALVPASDGSRIASVTIGRQVQLAGPAYDPLTTLPSGQRVWPDRPLYAQLADGAALEASAANLESKWTSWPDALPPLTITAGTDYDLLVLAIPPAAHRDICAGLIAQKPAWRAMADAVQTVATHSLQTWTAQDEAGLGWDHPAMVGGFDASNLNSWADISEVLKTECWPATAGVVAEQIACGPLPCLPYPPPASEAGYPAAQQALAGTLAATYLDSDARIFWPKRFGQGGPSAGTLVSSYNRINVDPGERYTLTVADSTRHRLRTDGSTYANLFLTGDWILNGQNLGSFEATTISGKLASRAISGFPDQIARIDAALYSTKGGPMAALPKFVEHAGSATFPGPITLNQTTMWAFLLKADRAKMTAWCQAMFDTPSKGAVRVLPLSSYMMMSVVDIGQGRFIDAPQMGWSSERELTFWIPAVRIEQRGGQQVATHFAMTMPYLVLNNPVAIAAGREIFGYFKQAGNIALPGDAGRDQSLTVDLFATKTFGTDSQEAYQRLLTLTPTASQPTALSKDASSFAGGARKLFELMAADDRDWHSSLGFDADLLGDLLHQRVPQLFLKQFRHIADGTLACYQAITGTFGEVTGFDSLPHLTEYDMVLEDLASSPVASDFGIAPRQTLLGAAIEYDMTILPGQVLWQA